MQHWIQKATMSNKRHGLAATTGHNGFIYAIGGYAIDDNKVGSVVGSIEVYDPVLDSWVSKVRAYDPVLDSWGLYPPMPMPTPRYQLAAATGPNGFIYAIGGAKSVDETPSSLVEVYDPVLNKWISVSNGEVYDPVLDKWILPPMPMPTPRYQLAAATGPNGLIYAIGGATQTSVLNTLEAYDPSPSQNTWNTKSAMITPRAGLAAVTGKDGAIYAIGGSDRNGLSLTTVEVYDPHTDRWQAVKPLSVPRRQLAAVVAADGRIYAIGGENSGVSLNTVEVYDPGTDSWAAVAPMPVARSMLVAAIGPDQDGLFPDGRLYAIGGRDIFVGTYSTMEAYTIPCLPVLSKIRDLQASIRWLNDNIEQIQASLDGDPGSVPIPKGQEAQVRKLLKKQQAELASAEQDLQHSQQELPGCQMANQ